MKRLLIEQAFAREEGAEFGEGTRKAVDSVYEPPHSIMDDMTVAEVLAQTVNVLVYIASGIAVIALMVAGIMWSLAAGDEEKIDKAKNYIKWSLAGLFISITAWSIVGFFAGKFSS